MSFYCKKESLKDFSIMEWDRRFKIAIDMGLTESEMAKFLDETKCDKQCEECACIVGERRLNTNKILNQ